MQQTSQLIKIPTVLIVEDDTQLADIFSKALDFEGYQTKVIYNGSQVNEALQQFNISLILLDIMLPGRDGFQILGDLRLSPITRNIPVIMLSNIAEDEYMQKSLNMGASDYIIKSNVDFQKIRKILHKHLISLSARKNMHVE